VATNGSDSSSGSLSFPLKSISHAFSKIKRGDTIEVRPGVYNENLFITNNTFVLKSEMGPDKTQITIENFYLDNNQLSNSFDLIEISGFSFKPKFDYSAFSLSKTKLNIKNCVFSNFGQRVFATLSSTQISNSVFKNNNNIRFGIGCWFFFKGKRTGTPLSIL
jgi:hypothetical protein